MIGYAISAHYIDLIGPHFGPTCDTGEHLRVHSQHVVHACFRFVSFLQPEGHFWGIVYDTKTILKFTPDCVFFLFVVFARLHLISLIFARKKVRRVTVAARQVN